MSSAEGAKEAADYLRVFASRLENGVKDIIEQSTKFGEKEAQNRFDAAEYPGFNDVTVFREKNNTETSIVAEGTTVLFIEYGAGVGNDGEDYAAEHGYIRGTYEQGKGANPPWVYAGVSGTGYTREIRPGIYRTYGNKANRCMFFTAEDVSDDIDQKIAEGKKKW